MLYTTPMIPIFCSKADLGSEIFDVHNSYKIHGLKERRYTTEPSKRKEFTVNVHEIHQMRIAVTKVWNQIYIWFAIVRGDFWFICSTNLKNLSENGRTRIQEKVVIIHCVIA